MARKCVDEIIKDHKDILKGRIDSVETEILRTNPNFGNVVDYIAGIGASNDRNLNICKLLDIDEGDEERCIRGISTLSDDARDSILNILSDRFKQAKKGVPI